MIQIFNIAADLESSEGVNKMVPQAELMELDFASVQEFAPHRVSSPH
jgi:hypothetical protein